MKADNITRRSLLKAGTAVAAPMIVPSHVLGLGGAVAPGEKIVLGGIGRGPRGSYGLSTILPERDVRFIAICDVQRKRAEAIKQITDRHYGNSDCVIYQDMFELIARGDIDAVLIATGDRWHALASLMAVRSGKDVYCVRVGKQRANSVFVSQFVRKRAIENGKILRICHYCCHNPTRTRQADKCNCSAWIERHPRAERRLNVALRLCRYTSGCWRSRH